MEALGLGLIAAVAWGVHDILVRYVSRTVGILTSLLVVLSFGGLVWALVVLLLGDFSQLNQRSILLSLASGIAFAVASVGHYNAFAKGPVRLVAPLIGVFAVLSFGFAAFAGESVTALQWIAVFALVAGIALISRKHETDTEIFNMPEVIGWCTMAMVGFAVTFALGQAASAHSDPVTSGLITRTTAILLVGIVFFVAHKRQGEKLTIPTGRQLPVLALMGLLDAIALGTVLAAGIYPHAEYASAASSIFGLVTVLLAWVFLKEAINTIQWLGVLVIFSSIAYLASA